MKRSYFLISGVSALVGAAVCAVVFVWLSRPTENTQDFGFQTDSPAPEKFVTRIQRDAEPRSAAPESKGRFDHVRTLADTLAFESDFDQTIAIHVLLANADEAFVLDLLRQAETISPPSQKEAAFSIIYSKYADIDPARALANAEGLPVGIHRRVLMNIFHEWARNDLESALHAADSLEGNQRQTASYVILTSRDDLEPLRRMEIAERFNLQRQLAALNSQLWVEKASENPRLAWQEILNSTDPNLKSWQVRASVAHAWIREEGIVVLDEILASLSPTDNKNEFISNLLPTLVQVDPQGAVDYISALSNTQQVSNLRRSVFFTWAQKDPEKALESLMAMDFHEKRSLMDFALSQWGRANPRKLLEYSDSMPQTWKDSAKQHALLGLARTAREEAIAYLPEIDDVRQRHELENRIASYWTADDPRAAIQWFLSLDESDSASRRHHLRQLIVSYTDEDPESALQLASQYSGEKGSSMISGAFDALARVDPQLALRYLPRVDKKQRKVAVERIGSAMARDDLMGALDLANYLENEDRSQFEKLVLERSFSWDGSRTNLLVEINNLPSRELKAHSALLLIRHNEYEEFLSEQDRQNLYAVLNATERAKLESEMQKTREMMESVEF